MFCSFIQKKKKKRTFASVKAPNHVVRKYGLEYNKSGFLRAGIDTELKAESDE